MPRDRERNRCVQQGTEVVGVMGVLPEVVNVNQQKFTDCLLYARIELVTETGLNCDREGAKYVRRQPANASCVRQEKVLVERRFHCPRVCSAYHRCCLCDVVGDAEARLRLEFRNKT